MPGALIKVAHTLAPGESELYPAGPGMQYLRNMLDGRAKPDTLEHNRCPDIRWTTAREVLSHRNAV